MSNKLLARLSRADARFLEPHLEPVDLPVRKMLQAPKRKVEQVYFLDRGVASMVANGYHGSGQRLPANVLREAIDWTALAEASCGHRA